jgi:sortase (surface protein transpeptidase)
MQSDSQNRSVSTTPAWLSVVALAVAVVAVAAALVGSDVMTGAVALPRVERIRAEAPPTPTPEPEVVVQAARAVGGPPSNECPQMNNPGGRLNWGPTKERGPFPTGGSIHLPTLGVQAPVVRVGIDGENRMIVPDNARDVAWLDRGGIPGYTNNVVLAGHIAYSRVAGSFMRIGSLRPGDEIVLKMNGETRRYRVIWTCLFGRNTDRAAQIMGYTDVPSVTLISCGGGWDAAARTHSGRWAVRAEQR